MFPLILCVFLTSTPLLACDYAMENEENPYTPPHHRRTTVCTYGPSEQETIPDVGILSPGHKVSKVDIDVELKVKPFPFTSLNAKYHYSYLDENENMKETAHPNTPIEKVDK